MFNKIRVIGIIIFSAILMTCGGGGGSSAPTEPTEPTYVINIVSLGGAAQKGPFNNGTIINIAELNNSLTPTGKNFTSQIIDNSGTFSVANVQMEFLYAEIRASGFYFDEVGNQVSSAQLVLLGLSNLAGKTNMNVNILSHLELNRIKNLLTGTTPLTFAQAKLQAQEEVLGIFGYSRAGVAESELLDITQAGAGNAKLLAISAILQDQRSVGELSELLANISTDITTDGVLDNTSITQSLLQSAYNLDLETIRTNLEARYAALGLSVTIPDFETEVNNFYKPPTVNDMSTSTDEDTAINITLDGSDPENESLTYSTVEVNNATVTISGNVANYVPTVNWNGTDTFTYMANDGSFNSNTATVTVTVGAIDDDPNTHDISTSTDEDVSVVMNLTADEYDGQNYSFSIIANPSNGTISLSGTTATYTPNQDWNGTDTFTFEATDDRIMFGQRNVATATITVNAINDAPISSEVSGSSDEDTAIDIELSATDVDQDNLTYSVVSDVSNGTTSISGSTLTYTPNQDWNGTDTFTYKVNDGTVDSNTSNGTITIAAVNDAPTTSDISTTIDENRTARMVGITLQGSDVDSDDLTYSVVSDASNGTTSISGATLTYTANQDWNGTETITYKANDGTVDSNTSTVTITVSPVDDSPINNSGSFTAIGDEDTPLEIVIDATDADGDDLNITTSFNASDDGTLTTDGLTITYIPKSNYYSHFDENGNVLGAVALDVSYTVWDGANGTGNNSDNHQIHIYARPVQDIPVSADMNVSVDEDYSGSENIKLNYSDPDSLGYSSGVGTDTVTYSIVSNPSNGSLSLNSSDNPNLTYTPTANYNGTDTFTYKANDGTVDSNTSTVTITVLAFDDAPVVPDSSFVIDEDQVLYIAITATDVDDEDLFTWAVYTDPSNGTAVIQDANSSATASKTYKYTPNSNFFGADSFQYYAANQNSQISNYGKLSFTINSVNDGPTTEDATASTDEDTAVVINIHESTSDIDSTVPSSLSGVEWIIVSQPSNGTLAWVNGGIITNPSSTFENGGGVVTYTPTANWNGTDTFTYKANDGADDGNTATVTITVNAVNDAPSCDSVHNVSTNEDESLVINLPCTDVEGDALTTVFESNYKTPKNGTLSVDGTTITYTPNANYEGLNEFEYHVSDGTNQSGIEVVNITVNAVDDLPTAIDLTASTAEDNSVDITLQYEDVEGDTWSNPTYELSSSPANGTVTLNTEKTIATYTPNTGFFGTDAFNYSTEAESSVEGTVTITIHERVGTLKVYPDLGTNYNEVLSDIVYDESTGGFLAIGTTYEEGDSGGAGTYDMIALEVSSDLSKVDYRKVTELSLNGGVNSLNSLSTTTYPGGGTHHYDISKKSIDGNFLVTHGNDYVWSIDGTTGITKEQITSTWDFSNNADYDGIDYITSVTQDANGDFIIFGKIGARRNPGAGGEQYPVIAKTDANLNLKYYHTLYAWRGDGNADKQYSGITFGVAKTASSGTGDTIYGVLANVWRIGFQSSTRTTRYWTISDTGSHFNVNRRVDLGYRDINTGVDNDLCYIYEGSGSSHTTFAFVAGSELVVVTEGPNGGQWFEQGTYTLDFTYEPHIELVADVNSETNGNFYVITQKHTSNGNNRIQVYKFNASAGLSLLWNKTVGLDDDGENNSYLEAVGGAAVDSQGNIAIVGSQIKNYGDSNGNQNANGIIILLDSDGNRIY